ncbi:RNA-directed DNA polymerase, eukaryota, reverse transcriptase zinc-binding domain protein, partial [Tanacetum coccineum]
MAHSKDTTPKPFTQNSFSALKEGEASEWGDESIWKNVKQVTELVNDSDSEDIEEVVVKTPAEKMGASTPNNEFSFKAGLFSSFSSLGLDIEWCLDDQAMHVRLWIKEDKKELFCTFVYAHNRYIQCRALWNSLSVHKQYVRDRPWCMLGDFNAALNLEDKSVGLNFTWNQKPRGEEGQLKKIDRIMANLEFNDVFLGAHAIFQPYRISDHSPTILRIPTCSKVKPKPFKFTNLLVHNERFKELVKDKWCMRFSGFHMYCVVQKLKSLKKPLQKLLFDHGNLYDNVVKLRMEVDKVQKDLDMDPFNINLREEEAAYVQAFNEALIMEERFLKQKAKIEWLRVGDSNSDYFHKPVKSHVSRSRINVISNSEGIVFSGDQVANAFVSHYEEFLGHKGQHSDLNTLNLFPNKLDPEDALNMIRPVTQKEVKDAMFSMGNDKSPGPDGFT